MKEVQKIILAFAGAVLVILATGIYSLISFGNQISAPSKTVLIILDLVAIAVCVFAGLLSAVSFAGMLKKAGALLNRAAEGDFDFELSAAAKRNAGLSSVEKLKSNISRLERETAGLCEAFKSGNLDRRADTGMLSGEFLKIADEFNGMMDMVVEKMHWYQSILDAIPFPVHVTDENMNWTFLNKNFEDLLKSQGAIQSREKSYGMPCCTAGANICNTESCGIQQLLKGKTESYFDWCGMNCKQNTAFLKNRKGKTIGYVEVVSDLTSLIRGNAYTKDAVAKLEKNLHELSLGNLKMDYGVAEGDNYTQSEKAMFLEINKNLEEAVGGITDYISEIKNALGNISSGNLQYEIGTTFNGDFAEIKNALINIIEKFNTVIGEINEAAQQVSAGSRQVSDGSQALSQGATEQASAIEELTSSISEIAEKTKENAKVAADVNRISDVSREDAETGSGHMKNLLGSMKEINEASTGISKIVKVIDDIAFQTNMLALNAAVEAARAGQYGKGFAVVAEEVRNLAARSSSAVKETTAMIESAIQKTQSGLTIASQTAEFFNKIVKNASENAELVDKIAESSNEQATEISQINKGIEQVSQVVQTNSATAEESAASSEELSSQSDLLMQMVGNFKLKKNSYETKEKAMPKSSGSPAYSKAAAASAGKFANKYDL